MDWFSGSSVVSSSHRRKHSSSSSHRRPRGGYIHRIYSQLRRWVREFIYYMRKHPVKMLMLVIMPLITGGALSGVLRKFGIRLPAGMGKSFDSYSSRSYSSSRGGGIDELLGGGGIGSLLKLVQMFT